MLGEAQAGWKAQLDLRFAPRGDRTELVHRAHHGPLVVQRPFHPEADGTCHVYLLHPPGGVVGGDELRLSAHAGEDSRVLLTTPAATKLYRTDGRLAVQHQVLTVEAGARMEWLPQETIVFDGATCRLTTRVQLAQGAHFIGWDTLCLGRPACGERFTRGELSVALEIYRDGLPLWVERFALQGSGDGGDGGDGGADVHAADWGLGEQPVTGTLVCVTPELDGLVERLRESAAAQAPHFVVSQLHDVLVCRYLGPSVEQARIAMVACWGELRRTLFGSDATAPRIWST